MPKLPTIENLGTRPSPTPAGGVARYSPTNAGELAVDKATVQLGGELMQAGNVLFDEKQRVDKLKAEDAYNQLIQRKNDLTVGPEGFMNYQGGDAINKPLLEDYGSQLQSSVDDLSNGLSNDNQRQFFQRRAGIAQLQLREDIQKHQYTEGQKFEDTTLQNMFTVEMNNISTRATDPIAFQMSTRRMLDGVDSSRHDAATKDKMKMAIISNANKSVIDNALAQGDDLYANEWYKIHKKEISDPDGSYNKKVSENSSLIQAGKAVDDVLLKMGPKYDGAPFQYDKMDKELRDKYSDNPTLLKAARTELATRSNMFNAAVKQREDSHMASTSKLIEQGADIPAVRNSASYMALPGDKQLQVLDYMKRKSAQIENITPEQFRSYSELSQPETLAKMSTEAIESTTFYLGKELADRLLAKKNLYAKEPEAKVDTQDFFHFMESNGIDPYDKDNKARIGELQFTIENQINTEQNAKKRNLTRDEKQHIIQRSTVQALLSRPGWFDKKVLSGEVTKPEDLAKAYIDISNITPNNVLAIKKSAAKLGVEPTDEQIGRAYFLFTRGFSAEDYLKSLK